nr:ATP synthase F0 subunit 6 [Penenirmus auritus]
MEKMSCGLFSSFDPGVWETGIGYKWLTAGVMVCLGCVYWQVFSLSSGVELMKEKMAEMVGSVVSQSSKSPTESMVIIWSLFLFILMSNLSGLVPFSFTLTSHLCVNLSLSIPLWGMGVLLFLWKPSNSFISHFLPTGSPATLWPFLVVIELVSWLIRPVTLGIRLMANMMAGHLITSLLSGMISKSSTSIVLYPIQSGLIMYEIGVSVIQAYVFMSLIILYSGEGE